MRILIAEDDEVSRTLLEGLLEAWGAVDVAVDAAEALESWRDAERDGTPYDLVCMDIDLGDGSGLDVLDVIRDVSRADEVLATKVLMVTGATGGRTVMDAFRRLADGYIVKPVSIRKLDEEMDRLGFRR